MYTQQSVDEVCLPMRQLSTKKKNQMTQKLTTIGHRTAFLLYKLKEGSSHIVMIRQICRYYLKSHTTWENLHT